MVLETVLETVLEDELGKGYVYLANHPVTGTYSCITRSTTEFASDANLRRDQIILNVDHITHNIGIEIIK